MQLYHTIPKRWTGWSCNKSIIVKQFLKQLMLVMWDLGFHIICSERFSLNIIIALCILRNIIKDEKRYIGYCIDLMRKD